MKSLILGVLLLVLSTGCSQVQSFVQADVNRAKELADKYGDAVASRCYTHLSGVLADNVASESVKGLISSAELARVLRNHINSNQDKFKAECGPLAAEIMIDVARRGR